MSKSKKNIPTMPTMDAPSTEGVSGVEETKAVDNKLIVNEADFKKPETDVEKNMVSNKKELSETVKSMIKVVAKASGFYNNRRIVPGESFYIKSKEHFGSWFECMDSELEKERKEFVRNKTLNARKKAKSKKASE